MRRLWSVAFVLGALFASLLLMGAASGIRGGADVVRAGRLEIVDADGSVRAELDVEPGGGPSLDLYDAGGVKRLRLNLVDDSIPRLTFFDEKGRTRELLGVSADGAAVKLFDEQGTMRVILGLYIDGTCGVALMDEKGEVRAGLVADALGDPSLDLFDQAGTAIFSIP
jgi:hypothetical protein